MTLRQFSLSDPKPLSSKQRLSFSKKLRFTLVIFTVALSIIFAGGEILCRWFKPQVSHGGLASLDLRLLQYSEDMYLGWELIPDRAHVGHNTAGFRGREYTKSKPEGTWRVAVIGDSVTYGLNIKAVETYPAALEHLLNESSGDAVEVLNFGVPGYNTLQQLTLLKSQVTDYEPDLVVMTFTPDDIETTPVVIKIGHEYSLFRNQLEGTLFGNRIHWSFFKQSYFYRFLYKKFVLLFVIDSNADFSEVYVNPEPAWWNIVAAATYCQERDIRFVLVFSPYLTPLVGTSDEVNELADRSRTFLAIIDLARNMGVNYVDLSPLYSKGISEFKIMPNDHEHLSPVACYYVAKELTPWILKFKQDSSD